ncbi:UDP-4-amino-4,6-dideoxy-N-acetyl-beta-L-altrosamine transaminase [Polynucleobacter necessarius]|uniref:UDP-4-amino-4, 6-dideoxy-N-acetyl-beta-L-altrosamine transaminase n=1 Tax=Polynucleobacter necessarius TaxID=576610 RepID=UPI000E09DF4C|nr:UDP-4-amino-4,6-dideoxy-N-acetyl-beta-L-altrosamine transaminase [Polynucleobacter necessarius]
MIPYARQSISEEDIEAVNRVLKSDFLTQGPVVPLFENAIKKYCKVDHAVVTSSATSALHIACMALDVGPGDLVWTSPNSFVASANCALYCGAQIDFVDIDSVTMNISIESLAAKLKLGKIPKVVIAVHFAGTSCDMRSIKRLSDQYGFKIIEDASHAIGGSYINNKIGSCEFSDVTVLSFHPVKIITTGEGGALLTNDEKIADRAVLLRSHGINRALTKSDSQNKPWFYEQIELGFNYRMTDIQAALGLSQLERINEFVDKRLMIASKYEFMLSPIGLKLPELSRNKGSAYHLYVIQIPDISEVQKVLIFKGLNSLGISANVHYIPIHLHPFYKALGFQIGDFPIAEKYYLEALSLPMYPGLADKDLEHICFSLKTMLNQKLN